MAVEVEELRRQLDAMVTSETWRFTLPIRLFIKYIRFIAAVLSKIVKKLILMVPYFGPKARNLYLSVKNFSGNLGSNGHKNSIYDESDYQLKAIALFDSDFYVKSNHLDINSSSAYDHYCNIGAKKFASPNRFFDVDGYIFDNPDVSDYNFNVLEHYCETGRFSKSRPVPIFDAEFCNLMYTDYANSLLHPYEFFLRHGWKLRKPTSPVLPYLDYGHVYTTEKEKFSPEVTVYIPTYKNYKDTYRCLASLMLNSGEKVAAKFVLVDDAPDAPIKDLISRFFPKVEYLVNNENLGFLLSCNQVAKSCDTTYLVIMNSDTIAYPHWLDSLVELAKSDEDIGYIGSMLVNNDGSIQEAGGTIYKNGWGFSNHAGKDIEAPEANYVREVDCVTGASIFLRFDAFKNVNFFDEIYAPAFYEEYDLAFKMWAAGYRVLFEPRSRIMHLGSGSYGSKRRDQLSIINHDKFVKKWKMELEQQPKVDENYFISSYRHKSHTVVVIDDAVPRPDTNAGSQTIFSIVKYLSENNVRVIFWGSEFNVEPKYVNSLRQLGVETHSPKEDFFSWFDECEQYIDTVLISRPLVATRFIPYLRDKFHGKLVYYTHDLHYLRMKRAEEMNYKSNAAWQSASMQEVEFNIFANVDLILSPSDVETRIIRDILPEREVATVTPYMYEDDQIIRVGSYENQRYLLFVGGFSHEPNVDAVHFLINEIMPSIWLRQPNLVLMVVGSDFPIALRHNLNEKIKILGHVGDLTDIYLGAFASICPLRFGAGVKGKVIESLRYGIPVITSRTGIEGTYLEDGQELLIADSPTQYSNSVSRLLESKDLWNKLSINGNQYVLKNYNLEIAGNQILELLFNGSRFSH